MKGTKIQEQGFVKWEQPAFQLTWLYLPLCRGWLQCHSFIQEIYMWGMTADLWSDHKSLQMCAFSQNRNFFFLTIHTGTLSLPPSPNEEKTFQAWYVCSHSGTEGSWQILLIVLCLGESTSLANFRRRSGVLVWCAYLSLAQCPCWVSSLGWTLVRWGGNSCFCHLIISPWKGGWFCCEFDMVYSFALARF